MTLRVEPAVDRFLRWRFLASTPPVLTDPAGAYVSYRLLPGWVQRHLLRDRWAVKVEADNGLRCLVKADNRSLAMEYAARVHDGVTNEGVGFLRTFAT